MIEKTAYVRFTDGGGIGRGEETSQTLLLSRATLHPDFQL